MSDVSGGGMTARLRKAFDDSFAKAVVVERQAWEDLMIIRTHDGQFVLRTREVSAILRCPPLTALPSAHAALCGLAGVRGTLVAVYSIAALVGEGNSFAPGGWVVVSGTDHSAALHFDELVGYRRVPAAQILAAEAAHAGAPAWEIYRSDGVDHTLLNVPALLGTVGETDPEKE